MLKFIFLNLDLAETGRNTLAEVYPAEIETES